MKDENIHYIMNKKKKSIIEKHRRNKIYGTKDYSMDSGRRDSILNSDTHSFNINGINFEIRSKCDNSSMNSLEYLKANVSKDMNLMCYDFNGSKKRMNRSEERRVGKECRIRL